MSKFEIKLTDDELDQILKGISNFTFPELVRKSSVALFIFGKSSSWNIRKVREAVSRLQSKGFPIIAHHGGYSVFSDDPQPVIEYLNREYHRVHEATKKNDQIFAALKRKYGDNVSEKVHALPEQPMLDIIDCQGIKFENPVMGGSYLEPPFHKSYNVKGEQIEP